MLLLLNFGDRPHAGEELIAALRRALRERGAVGRIERSRSIAHAFDLIRRAWEAGERTVLVGGGDGTLNVALNHPLAPRLTLGVLPLGTVNAFARSIGLGGGDVAGDFRRLLRGGPRPVDVGVFTSSAPQTERRFLCFASAGFDAAVARRATGKIKVLLRRGAFGLVGAAMALRLRSLPRFRFRASDGSEGAARQLVLSNIVNYAGFPLFNASPTDGALEGFAWDGRSFWDLLELARRAAAGPADAWMDAAPGLRPLRRVRRVRLASRAPFAAQLDGEPLGGEGFRRAEFRLAPVSQSFLLPGA